MTKNIQFFLALLLLGWFAQLFLPWWSFALVALLLAFFIKTKAGASIGLAFLAGLLLWGGHALWLDLPNAGSLSSRMGDLFQGVGRFGILGITSIIGGLLGLFGAWVGLWSRRLFA